MYEKLLNGRKVVSAGQTYTLRAFDTVAAGNSRWLAAKQDGKSSHKFIMAVSDDNPMVMHQLYDVLPLLYFAGLVESAEWDIMPPPAPLLNGQPVTMVQAENADVRTLDIRFRASADEKIAIQKMAVEAGMTVSEFIRDRIGL